MPYLLTPQFNFITGAVRRRDIVYASMVPKSGDPDMRDVSFPLSWLGTEWSRDDDYAFLPWSVVRIAVAKYPFEQGVFVGAWGEAYVIGAGESHEETIATEDGPRQRGPLRSACSAEGRVLAVGMDRQAWRRDDAYLWTSIDQGMRPDPGDTEAVGLEAVSAFSADEIYACGHRGELWRRDAATWRNLPLDTNLVLTSICCAGDGAVYVAGQSGVLLAGRGDRFAFLDSDPIAGTVWDLAWYNGNLYLATDTILYRRDAQGVIAPVDLSRLGAATFNHLDASDEVLWSFGEQDVLALDGSTWTRID